MRKRSCFVNYADIFKCMSILILIQISTIISLINHLWFKTDFFCYYCRLLKSIIPKEIYSYLLIDEFFTRPESDYIYDSYIEYLYSKRCFTKNFVALFFLKLASCPLCLTTWLSILCCILYLNILYTGILFLLIRSIDFLLNFFLKSH